MAEKEETMSTEPSNDVESGDVVKDESMNSQKLNRGESVLDRHTDPFAPREGKTLVWRNVNMTLVSL